MYYNNVSLIRDLTKRDITSKYKGSLLGPLWSVITPLLLLSVYTFVFGTVFKSKWPGFDSSQADFAISLFIGMLTFNIFSDSVSKSPWIISSNASFVKKVIFPIEILPVVNVLSSIYNFAMGFVAWFFIMMVFHGFPPPTFLLIPLFIVPIVIFSLGVSWIVSALGVYFKDVGQFIGVLVMLLMFSSPVFYSIESIPMSYRIFFEVNPIALTITTVRDLAIFGQMPSAYAFCINLTLSVIVAYLGLSFFKKSKRGFSDVL